MQKKEKQGKNENEQLFEGSHVSQEFTSNLVCVLS